MTQMHRFDRIFERVRVFVKSPRLVPTLGAFLVGFVTNLLANSSGLTLSDFLRKTFWSHSLSSLLIWLLFAAIAFVIILRHFLEWYRRKHNYEALLARFLKNRADIHISYVARGGPALGSAMTLQLSPDLREGWSLRDVRIEYSGLFFDLGDQRAPYDDFMARNKTLFVDDRPKFALAVNPTAFTDQPTLVLKLVQTKYSEVQFYRDCVATVQSKRDQLILDVVRSTGGIGFPSSLCMHSVVVTADHKVLLTKRAPKVRYYPHTWSVSVEENLSEDDLKPGNDGAILRWAKRFLLEELGVAEKYYEDRNLRVLAVFLEGDILNCSLAAVFKLSVEQEELDQLLKIPVRSDYEFSHWEFIGYRRLAQELRQPTRLQHPTSAYRSLLFLANVWGLPKLMEVLFDPAHV
jgi:hypothetical protein